MATETAERKCLRCEKEIPKWRSKNETFCTGVCRLKFREEQRHKKAADRAFEEKNHGLIRVHSCLASSLDPYDKESCRCRLMVSEQLAKELVAQGEAVDFTTRTAIVTSGPLLLIGVVKKTPRSQTIEKAHVERLGEQKDLSKRERAQIKYLQESVKEDRNWRERERLEDERADFYQFLTVQAMNIRQVPAEEYDVMVKNDPWRGRSILTVFQDERGSVGKDVSGSSRDIELEDQPLELEERQPDSKPDPDFIEADVETVSLEDAVPEEDCDEEVLVED